MQKLIVGFNDEKKENNLDERPDWTILRKQTQGIVDCLFKYKFDHFCERMIQLNSILPKSINNQQFEKSSGNKRPWSVSALPVVYNQASVSTMSNRISSLCSDNAYFGFLIYN